ncbi:MAG: UvrB/UvrC motif-containing protein [Oscillospiraceae bacterium]
MKCERCNEKEASFFYSSDINGKKTSRCLCADCARAEGFGGALDYRPAGMLGSLFDDVFSDFFAPAGSFFPTFGSFGSPLRSIMTQALPRIDVVIGQPGQAVEPLEESETRIPSDAGSEVRRRRELSALKHQLKEAVKAEDFEKAIQLRDQIKELEG